MVITHNMGALNAQRQFGINTKTKAKTAEKLSSGYKINRASDDAAGLSISEKMRKQIRGLTQGVENTEAGVSLCQVADGALAEVHDMLQRINELSIQSANGTNSYSDRQAIQEEINQLLTEIDRIGDTTSFNEKKIFKGNNVGADGDNTVYIPPTISELSVMGTPTDTVAMTYSIIADENGFSINSDTYTWDVFSNGTNTLANSTIDTGTYSFDYKGFTLSLSASDNATKEDLIKRMNGASFSTDVDGYTYKTTAIGGKLSTGMVDDSVNIGVYTEPPSNGKFVLKVDAVDQLWLYGEDGSVYSGYDLATFASKDVYQAGERQFLEITDGGNGLIGPWIYIEFTEETTKEEYLDMVDGATVYFDVDSIQFNNSLGKFFFKATELELSSAKIATSGLKLDSVKQTGYKGTPLPNQDVSTDMSALDIWIQSGCDAGDGIPLEIDRMNTTYLGINGVNVTTIDGADHAMTAVGEAIQKLSASRSKIGAQQNRLEHTIANEDNIIENTTAAESRIRDADMAELMVQFSKENILEQVGQSMMAQANQSTQGVLSLLQ